MGLLVQGDLLFQQPLNMEQISVYWVGISSHFLKEGLLFLIAPKGILQTLSKLLVATMLFPMYRYTSHIENPSKFIHTKTMKTWIVYKGIFWTKKKPYIRISLEDNRENLFLLRCSLRIFGLYSTSAEGWEKLGSIWRDWRQCDFSTQSADSSAWQEKNYQSEISCKDNGCFCKMLFAIPSVLCTELDLSAYEKEISNGNRLYCYPLKLVEWLCKRKFLRMWNNYNSIAFLQKKTVIS